MDEYYSISKKALKVIYAIAQDKGLIYSTIMTLWGDDGSR